MGAETAYLLTPDCHWRLDYITASTNDESTSALWSWPSALDREGAYSRNQPQILHKQCHKRNINVVGAPASSVADHAQVEYENMTPLRSLGGKVGIAPREPYFDVALDHLIVLQRLPSG